MVKPELTALEHLEGFRKHPASMYQHDEEAPMKTRHVLAV